MERTIKLGLLNLAIWDFVAVATLAGEAASKNYNLHPVYALLIGCGAGVLLLLMMRIRFLGSLLQVACGLLWSQAIWRLILYFYTFEDPKWSYGIQGFLAILCVGLHFLSIRALLGPKKNYVHRNIDSKEVEDKYLAVDLETDPEEIRERFWQIKEDFLDACDERDEVMDLAQEILDEDDSSDTDELYRLMLENDRKWTEGMAKMDVYADMIQDAKTYQEQKHAMSRAERLLSDLERATFTVMRETNRIMAMEKAYYLEEEDLEAYDEEYDEEYAEAYDEGYREGYEENLGKNSKKKIEDNCGEREEKQQERTAYEEYERRKQTQQNDIDVSLFAGCRDKDSLTKRYRNLMKTFHPDNQDGDTEMTIKVQKTYDYLAKQMG